MRRRKAVKMPKEAARMTATIISSFGDKKVNSKKLRINGTKNAVAMMATMETRRPARSLLRGLDIQ